MHELLHERNAKPGSHIKSTYMSTLYVIPVWHFEKQLLRRSSRNSGTAAAAAGVVLVAGGSTEC